MNLRLPERRDRWAQGLDGFWETMKDEDATERYGIDFTERMRTGESVTGVSWARESGGLSFTDEGVADNVATVLVQKTGILKGTVTTSAGRTLIQRVRFLAKEE